MRCDRTFEDSVRTSVKRQGMPGLTHRPGSQPGRGQGTLGSSDESGNPRQLCRESSSANSRASTFATCPLFTYRLTVHDVHDRPLGPMNHLPPPMVQDEVPQTSGAEDGGTLHPSLLLSFSSAQKLHQHQQTNMPLNHTLQQLSLSTVDLIMHSHMQHRHFVITC